MELMFIRLVRLFAFILKQYIKFIETEVECSTYFNIDGRNLVPRVTYSI